MHKTSKNNLQYFDNVEVIQSGIRKDPYANAHPIQVEEDKPETERGHYIHPELYDEPAEKAISPFLVPPRKGKGRLYQNILSSFFYLYSVVWYWFRQSILQLLYLFTLVLINILQSNYKESINTDAIGHLEKSAMI